MHTKYIPLQKTWKGAEKRKEVNNKFPTWKHFPVEELVNVILEDVTKTFQSRISGHVICKTVAKAVWGPTPLGGVVLVY